MLVRTVWVPKTLSMALTCGLASVAGVIRALPDGHAPGVTVAAEPAILGDQQAAVLYRGRVDQAVGGIAGKRRRQGHRGRRDRGRHPEGTDIAGKLLQPRPEGDGEDNPFVCGQPGQFEPGDRGDCELVGRGQGLGGGGAEPLGFGRPPLHDVGVEQDGGHARSQVAPVLNSSSSSALLIATPVSLPFRVWGPLAGTRRATVRPCLVISISSPAATSSSRERILAFTSVAVI